MSTCLYSLFSDAERWHAELKAVTFRAALREAREKHGITGRVRLVRENGDTREYKKAGTRYVFTVQRVFA